MVASSSITLFIALPLLIFYILPFDRYKREPYYIIGSNTIRALIKFSFFWRVTVNGKEKLKDMKEPCVYVANHQSYFDILVLYFLDKKFKCVSKKSLNYIPYFGMYLYLIGNISIERTNPKSIKKVMDTCSFYLKKQKYSVFLFPEGTRLKPGQEPLKFKKGAFQLAIDNQVPITPVVINGIKNSISLKKFLTRKGKFHISIDVLEQIDYKNFKDIKEYMDYTKKEMQKKLICS